MIYGESRTPEVPGGTYNRKMAPRTSPDPDSSWGSNSNLCVGLCQNFFFKAKDVACCLHSTECGGVNDYNQISARSEFKPPKVGDTLTSGISN